MAYGALTMLLGVRRRGVLYGGFALYAAGVALFSGPGLDHWWGAWAAGGYALAAAVSAWGRPWSGRAAIAAALAGALIGPALWLMTREPTPPDVAVVARSGVLLLHHGSPYLPVSGLAGWLDYTPYLPVMALFGVPGALGLPGKTWPWLIAATFLLLYLTFRVTLRDGTPRQDGTPRPGSAAFGYAAFWLVCPVMAFPLTMGITDPPIITLTCLGLALLARGARAARVWEAGAPAARASWNRDYVAAAVVLGVACAMKYTAWPALVIVVCMVAARDGLRMAVRFAAGVLAAAAALVAALAPAALGDPASLVRNTVDYPLGLTGATSPAASPLPGHLLATLGSGGHLAALLLLACAGIAIAFSLLAAPPATPAAAARRIAIGLTALFLLAPATRFGYFIYPISLYAWALLADRQDAGGRPDEDGDQWDLGLMTGRAVVGPGVASCLRLLRRKVAPGRHLPFAMRGIYALPTASRLNGPGAADLRGLNLTRCHPLQFEPMTADQTDQAAASWSVGQLARATGLSVRVLRHWEEMGVVAPERSAGGQRRYGPAQVTRLYRAVALRRAGFGLGQIAALLAGRDPDPAATLRAHLAQLEEDLRRHGELRDRLAAALHAHDENTGGPRHDTDRGTAAALMKVIETMTMFEQYVHGYRAEENLRLQDQASTLVDLLHDGTAYPRGSRVLEAGCGVGAQTETLGRRSPDARLTAIDTSAASLARARERASAAGITGVTFREADVFSLPRADGELAAGTFDHVFVCFLLEHLDRPAEALTRLRAMLRPGGTITVIEGDHGSAYFHPDSAAARDAIGCQVTLQRHAGGDAMIGRRLYPLLTGAGYRDVAVSPRVVYADGGNPALGDGFIRKTFTAMIEGVREPAVAGGLIDPARFDEGIRDLYRTAEADGVFCYTFFKAVGVA